MRLGTNDRTEMLAALGGILPKADEAALPFVLRYSFCADTYDNSPVFLIAYITELILSDAPGFAVFEQVARPRSGRNPHLIGLVLRDCLGDDAGQFGEDAVLTFDTADRMQLETLLHLAMLSLWTVHLYAGDGATRVRIDHDSSFDVHSRRDPAALRQQFTRITGRNL